MRRLAVGAAVAAIALAACGGDDGGPGAAPEPTDSVAAEAATPDSDSTAVDEAMSGDPSPAVPTVVDAPELLQFTNALVGGGEFDATTTAGTPTAFWFWSPT